MSPNGDGHVIGYQDPPSLPSVNNCLWIITTNAIYHNHFTRTPAPPSFFVLAAPIPREPLSVRGEAATPTCGSAGPNLFLSERAWHSYDVEEDEEEVEEKDAPASRVENGAAVKLVRHFAHTGAQLGDGSGTDFKHVVHCQPQSVRLASSGFVK